MTKYMTMKEAFECGDNGIPFIKGFFNNFRQRTKKELLAERGITPESRPSIDQALSDQWQVIPAESKVLTADQIRTKVRAEDPINTKSVGTVMYECADYGIESGRLERDLEYKELIEAVGKVLSWEPGKIKVGDFGYTDLHNLLNALKNLKPLNKDEGDRSEKTN